MVEFGRRLPGTTLPRANQHGDGRLDPEAVDQNMREIERRLQGIPVLGDTPPGVEVVRGQELQAGQLYGTMRVLVDDVGSNFDGYVRFALMSGPGEFDHDDPTDTLVWNLTDTALPYTAAVELEPKHGGRIAAAVPWRKASDPDTLLWVIVPTAEYDSDWDAELDGHSISFDDNGIVLLSLKSDEDGVKMYVTVGIAATTAGATPADPTTGSNHGVLVGQDGSLKLDGTGTTTLRQAAMGQVVGLKVICENQSGAVNPKVFGTYFKLRGDSKKLPPRVRVQATRSGATVTVVVEVDDPTLSASNPEFKARHAVVGGIIDPTWQTSWDSSTGTAGTDTALSRTESIMSDPGLDGEFILRVPWTDEVGNTQYVGDAISLANLEEVTKTLRVAYSALVPRDETQSWFYAGGYLRPLVAGNYSYNGTTEFPPGVTLTEIRARMYRQTTSDSAVVAVYRFDDTTGYFGLATLTHSSTGWQTVSAAVSQLTGSPYGFDFDVLLNAVASAVDARVKWVEFVYTTPSYENTI